MRGKLLSFLDLLAITVAVMVMILAIVPDQPAEGKPTEWYIFNVALDAHSIKDPSSNLDLTPKLKIGFLLEINGKKFDIHSGIDPKRQFLCDHAPLELICLFLGEVGEKFNAKFFIRDDEFVLVNDSHVKATIQGEKMGIPLRYITLGSSNRFSNKSKGILK